MRARCQSQIFILLWIEWLYSVNLLKQLPSSWPLSAAQLPLHFMNKHANQQVTLSDLIGPGNLAVDFICRGLMSINNFVLNPTLRVFVLKLATRWYSRSRTKVISNAVVRWNNNARALKGDPPARTLSYHNMRYETRINQVFYRIVNPNWLPLSLFSMNFMSEMARTHPSAEKCLG